MHTSYQESLEARLYALMRSVCDGSVSAEEATFFVCDEIRVSFHRGQQTGEGEEKDKGAALRRRAIITTPSV